MEQHVIEHIYLLQLVLLMSLQYLWLLLVLLST